MPTVTEVSDGTHLHVGLFDSHARRCWEIDGLDPGQNATDLLVNAIRAVGGVQFGAQHPTLPGIYVATYDVRPMALTSKSACMLVVDYSSPNRSPTLNVTTIEVAGSNAQTLLNRWPKGTGNGLDGKPFIIAWAPNPPPGNPNPIGKFPIDPALIDPEEDAADFGIYYDTVSIPIDSVNSLIRFTRLEAGSPLNKSTQFRRTINSTPWFSFAAGTVLCRNIDGQNIVGAGDIIAPGLYRVTYLFEHNPDPQGWLRAEIFRDSQTGRPAIVDTTDGTFNGYGIFAPYRYTDFNALSLPDPTV